MEQKIIVKNAKGKGRGVYALQDFKIGEIVESCPVLNFNSKERKILEKTYLNYYIYPWRSLKTAAVVLGYGFIYNHSYTPNADWKQDFKKGLMIYRTIKPIKEGEEILVNYNGESDNNEEIDWFEDGKLRKF